MTDDDLDRILTSAEPLLPSSGFVASVMDQIRQAETTPAPLPFPWRRFSIWAVLVCASAGFCGWCLDALNVATAVQTALAGPLAALTDPHFLLLSEVALASVVGT